MWAAYLLHEKVMQFYYGEKNLLRALDEAEFWKHQESEHTTVVQLVTPGLEPIYVTRLQQFEQEINSIRAQLVKYIESAVRSKGMLNKVISAQITSLIKKCLVQSNQFVEFLEEMLLRSEAVKASKSSQTVIHHLIRESQYFIGIDQLIL